MASIVGISNLVILALATVLIAVVLRERLWKRNPIGRIHWSDAWLKAAVIVVFAIIFVAYLPSWVLQSGSVAGLSRPLQDLIGTAVWAVGFAVLLGGLRLAHRGQRV